MSLLIRPFPLWESLAHEADDAVDQKDAPAATESPTARAERLGYAAVKTVKAIVPFPTIRLNGRLRRQ